MGNQTPSPEAVQKKMGLSARGTFQRATGSPTQKFFQKTKIPRDIMPSLRHREVDIDYNDLKTAWSEQVAGDRVAKMRQKNESSILKAEQANKKETSMKAQTEQKLSMKAQSLERMLQVKAEILQQKLEEKQLRKWYQQNHLQEHNRQEEQRRLEKLEKYNQKIERVDQLKWLDQVTMHEMQKIQHQLELQNGNSRGRDTDLQKAIMKTMVTELPKQNNFRLPNGQLQTKELERPKSKAQQSKTPIKQPERPKSKGQIKQPEQPVSKAQVKSPERPVSKAQAKSPEPKKSTQQSQLDLKEKLQTKDALAASLKDRPKSKQVLVEQPKGKVDVRRGSVLEKLNKKL